MCFKSAMEHRRPFGLFLLVLGLFSVLHEVVTISCGDPGFISNADRKGHFFSFPHSIKYVCHEGYRMVGIDTKFCSGSGTWQPTSIPYCEEILCPALAAPANGKVVPSNRRYGSTAYYLCDRYYKLVGDSKQECLINGSWSGNRPVCEKITCKAPDKFPNGRMIGKKDTVYNATDILIFRCNDGVTHSVSVCLENGEWNRPPPTCPGSLVTEDVQTGHNTTDDILLNENIQTAHYNTDDILVTEDVQSAHYTTDAVTISCGDPGLISNADRKGHFFSFPHSVKYVCHEGYRMVGIDTKFCSDSGTWQPTSLPYCEEILCPALAAPANGKVLLSNRRYGSTAYYECDRYYKLVGDSKRECLINGSWSGNSPVCEKITCKAPDKFPNGRIIGKKYTVYNTTDILIVLCNDGVTVSISLCLENGEWNHLPPTCPDILVTEDVQNAHYNTDDILLTEDVQTAHYNTEGILVTEDVQTAHYNTDDILVTEDIQTAHYNTDGILVTEDVQTAHYNTDGILVTEDVQTAYYNTDDTTVFEDDRTPHYTDSVYANVLFRLFGNKKGTSESEDVRTAHYTDESVNKKQNRGRRNRETAAFEDVRTPHYTDAEGHPQVGLSVGEICAIFACVAVGILLLGAADLYRKRRGQLSRGHAHRRHNKGVSFENAI